ncbi:hypothetical protein [Fimbriiglobus ruber]|uniref:hypothetical protein n=1 Tax=Fimbriiglobus ruber TaxID=1908690 RepID=UPI00117AD7FA|nr:hypothetical protein [Fimbriiglobus ruber]
MLRHLLPLRRVLALEFPESFCPLRMAASILATACSTLTIPPACRPDSPLNQISVPHEGHGASVVGNTDGTTSARSRQTGQRTGSPSGVRVETIPIRRSPRPATSCGANRSCSRSTINTTATKKVSVVGGG